LKDSQCANKIELITHCRNKDAAQDTVASSKLVLVQRRFSRVVIEGKKAGGPKSGAAKCQT
jgi:hypothetical protein